MVGVLMPNLVFCHAGYEFGQTSEVQLWLVLHVCGVRL